MAVVARARLDRAAAQLIDAAVADVRPIRAAVLDEAHGAGGARLVIERDAIAELDDAVVSARERQGQEPLRIEYRVRRLRERFLERRDRHLGGSRAVRVPAHAVDDDHQQRLAVRDEVDSILVFRPMARQGQFCIDRRARFVTVPLSSTSLLSRPARRPSSGAQPGRKLDVHSVPRRKTRSDCLKPLPDSIECLTA